MSFDSQLVHSCDVRRPTHTVAGQSKVFAFTSVATGVACRIEANGDSAQATIMGIGVAQSRKLFFAGDADIQPGDSLEASTGETMTIRSVEQLYAGGPACHHLEAFAEVRDA